MDDLGFIDQIKLILSHVWVYLAKWKEFSTLAFLSKIQKLMPQEIWTISMPNRQDCNIQKIVNSLNLKAIHTVPYDRGCFNFVSLPKLSYDWKKPVIKWNVVLVNVVSDIKTSLYETEPAHAIAR